MSRFKNILALSAALAPLVFLLSPNRAETAVPQLINFQGILKDGSGNPVANGSYSVIFTIYDAPVGGNVQWAETSSVTTSGGLFTILLGSTNPVPDSAFEDASGYLGIKVGADPEMTPRQQLVSLSYAYRVSSVDGASGGTITSKVSIGPGHTNTGTNAFVAGINNTASGNEAAVGGGTGNNAFGYLGTIAGGYFNQAGGTGAFVGGGSSNIASGLFNSFIGGGYANQSSGQDAAISGGQLNIASGLRSFVGGGSLNKAHGDYSVVSGGGGPAAADSNAASGDWSGIHGGTGNTASGLRAAIGGGYHNTSSASDATVGGGFINTASGPGATVAGGGYNTASGFDAAVGGGDSHLASGNFSAVAGGWKDTASGFNSTVPGGFGNKASGNYSFAAGRRAKAGHLGSFVWADSSTDADFASTGNNQFVIRAAGGVGIGTASPAGQLHVHDPFNSINGSRLILTQAAGGSTIFDGLAVIGGPSKGYLWNYENGPLIFGTNNSERIRIDSVGNIGVGIIAPTARLQVGTVGSEGTPPFIAGTMVAVQATNPDNWTHMAIISGSLGQSRLNFGDGFNDDQGTVGYSNAIDAMFFTTAAAERMRITSTGQVGIGTATPQGALDVSSTTGAFIVPRMTTAQRNALTPVNGMIIYNTDAVAGGRFEFRENGAWVTK